MNFYFVEIKQRGNGILKYPIQVDLLNWRSAAILQRNQNFQFQIIQQVFQ